MILHTYDMDSGEYTGQTTAQKRPNGDDITDVLGATTVAPPQNANGKTILWSNGAWSLVDDHRQKYNATGVKTGGTPYWLDGDTHETAARYMTALGPLPDGALLAQPEKPVPTLDEAKSAKISELDAEATAKITAGFWYADEAVFDGNLHFSFGTEDQINFSDTMTGATLALSADSALAEMLPNSVTWNGYSDVEHANLVTVTFTAAQFLAFWAYAQTAHKNAILEQVREMKAAVVDAATVEAVDAVVWGEADNSDGPEGL